MWKELLTVIVATYIVRELSADQLTECRQALGNSRVTVNTGRGAITAFDPYDTSTQCRKVLFTEVFPTDTCDLGIYPQLGDGTFASAEFTREAAIIGTQCIGEAASIADIGLSDAIAASSVNLQTIKAIASLISARSGDLVDSQCRALLPQTGNSLSDRVRDYSLIFRVRELLRAAPQREVIGWPDSIITPAVFLSRADTRHFLQSLFNNHNLKAILLQLQDLQTALSEQASNTYNPPATSTPSNPTEGPSQAQVSTPGAARPEEQPITEAPGGGGREGSGRAPEERDQPRIEEPKPAVQSQREKDIERYAASLVNVPPSRYDDLIAKLKQLEAAGALDPLPGFADKPLTDLQKAFITNPSFKKHDNRHASQKNSPDISSTDTDQNSGLLVLGEAVQRFRDEQAVLDIQQDRRIKELTDLIQGLTSRLGAKQGNTASGTVRVQVEALKKQIQAASHCCGKTEDQIPRPWSKANAVFYSLGNLGKVYNLLEHFIRQYTIYQHSLPSRRQGRDAKNNTRSKSHFGKFKKLIRSGNIFADVTQSTLAINELLAAYNKYSEVVGRFHPNQLNFEPSDYVQRTKQLLGLASNATLRGTSNTTQSLYQKVISAVQRRYPDLSECCIVAYIAVSISSSLSLCAIITFLITYCCCCEARQGRCCCRRKELSELCPGSSCCVGQPDEENRARTPASRVPFEIDNRRPAPTTSSRQRGSAPLSPSELATFLPSDPVRMWDTVKQLHSPNQAQTAL